MNLSMITLKIETLRLKNMREGGNYGIILKNRLKGKFGVLKNIWNYI